MPLGYVPDRERDAGSRSRKKARSGSTASRYTAPRLGDVQLTAAPQSSSAVPARKVRKDLKRPPDTAPRRDPPASAVNGLPPAKKQRTNAQQPDSRTTAAGALPPAKKQRTTALPKRSTARAGTALGAPASQQTAAAAAPRIAPPVGGDDYSEWEISSLDDYEEALEEQGAQPHAIPNHLEKIKLAQNSPAAPNSSAGLKHTVMNLGGTGRPGANTHLLVRMAGDSGFVGIQKTTATATATSMRRLRPTSVPRGTKALTFPVPAAGTALSLSAKVLATLDGDLRKKLEKQLSNVHSEMYLLLLLTGGDKSKLTPGLLKGATLVVDKACCADCLEELTKYGLDRAKLRDGTEQEPDAKRRSWPAWSNPFEISQPAVREELEAKLKRFGGLFHEGRCKPKT